MMLTIGLLWSFIQGIFCAQLAVMSPYYPMLWWVGCAIIAFIASLFVE
jgi:hypothetical protein